MIRVLALVGLGLGLASVPAGALRVRALDTRDLVREAAVVVRGEVRESHAQWNEAHDQIVTDSRIEVHEVLVGRAGPVLTVRQWGGTVGDVEMKVAGVRTLRVGESVLLFLRQDTTRHYLVGFSQGSLFLEKGADGTLRIRREISALERVVSGTEVRPPREREPYEPLRAEVRRIAAELGR